MVHRIKKRITKAKDVFNYEGFKLYSTHHIPFMILFLISTSVKLSGQTIGKKTTDQITKEMVSKIQTDIDPNFIYDYEYSKFVPPDGKTLLIMGQTVEKITEYMDHFQHQPIPGGWSAYWGIPEFVGITETHRNETGSSQNHQMLIDSFPNTVVQSAMWMVGKWDIAENAPEMAYTTVLLRNIVPGPNR